MLGEPKKEKAPVKNLFFTVCTMRGTNLVQPQIFAAKCSQLQVDISNGTPTKNYKMT